MAAVSSVSLFSFYCTTEAATVTVWSPTSPTVCPHNSAHTVDLSGLIILQTVIASTNSTSVRNYRIYCDTEAAWVTGWSVDPPIKCYNNISHSVNLNSVQEITEVSENAVKIVEDAVEVSRNISNDAISVLVPSASSGSATYVFKFPNSFYSYQFGLSDIHQGDELTIAINPNTVLGHPGADITTGATTFIAPMALLMYGQVGYFITITDGVNTNELGLIRSINKVTGVVTMDVAATNDFVAASTLIKMTYYVMRSVPLSGHGVFGFGQDIIGGNPVPVGTSVVVTYKNNTTDVMAPDKRFTMFLTLRF